MNYDKFIINYREMIYTNYRRNIFIKMFLKHKNNKCNCAQLHKYCILKEIINFNNFNDSEYLGKLYDSHILDSLYNIMQSITQSLRTNTGKTFENIIELTFNLNNMKNKIHYGKQICIYNNTLYDHKIKNGNYVDFIIPYPSNFPIHVDEFNGIIISCKTTLRERYLQDKYLNDKVIYITLQNTNIPKNTIYIDSKNLIYTKWLNNISNKTKMKTLDLFCGAGGFTKGFIDSREFDVVAGIDINEDAIETYNYNNSHLGIVRDLTKYSPEQFSEECNVCNTNIDVILAGIPCQGFSIAGKRDINDPRNTLFMEFIKYLNFFNPKAFMIENVVGILSMKNNENRKCIDIILELVSKNYNVKIYKLCASDFEVPQNRKRVIICGIRKDLNILPFEQIYPNKNNNKNNYIVKNYLISDKTKIPSNYFLSEKAILGIQNKKQRMKSEGKGFGAQFLKLDSPSYTIPARYYKDGYDALVKYSDTEIRRLTELELARIQSFPDNYVFKGNRKNVVMQIGNAVPPRFAMHLAINLKNMLNNDGIKDYICVNIKT